MKENKTVFIALCTNIGNRKQNLQAALEKIAEATKITKESSIYETNPVGYKEQGKFLNMAIEIETELSPVELMTALHEIEHKMGRNRDTGIKNGPRIIDLDILLYGNEKIDKPNLKIPHPRMHEREFVLKPLSEINHEYR